MEENVQTMTCLGVMGYVLASYSQATGKGSFSWTRPREGECPWLTPSPSLGAEIQKLWDPNGTWNLSPGLVHSNMEANTRCDWFKPLSSRVNCLNIYKED